MKSKDPKLLAKRYSEIQESRIAKSIGGRVQPNSGGTRFGGGDIHTQSFLVEAKTQTEHKKSFTIKEEWITKAREQAFEQGKSYSALAFSFDPEGPDYFIIDAAMFEELIYHYEKENPQ